MIEYLIALILPFVLFFIAHCFDEMLDKICGNINIDRLGIIVMIECVLLLFALFWYLVNV